MPTSSSTAIEKATLEIEQVLEECNAAALAEMPALKQVVALAAGVTKLRHALTDDVMRQVFMPLQGTALGFRTDKDEKGDGYPLPVVRDCIVEALVAGFRPINNELNIIAGRFYGAKNGYARQVREFPGLSDLRLTPGVPHNVGDRGSLVPMRASWLLNGQPMELVRDLEKLPDGTSRDTRIPVRVNSGMGPDAVLGKAHRKMLKAIYDLLTGSALTVDDGEVLDAEGETVSETVDASPAPAPPAEDGQRKPGRQRKSSPPPDASGPPPDASGPPPMPDDLPPGRMMGED